MSHFAVSRQKIGALYLPDSSNTGCYKVDQGGITRIEERFEDITETQALVMFDVFAGDLLIGSINSSYVSSVSYLSH